jgi:hypothetical protein
MSGATAAGGDRRDQSQGQRSARNAFQQAAPAGRKTLEANHETLAVHCGSPLVSLAG